MAFQARVTRLTSNSAMAPAMIPAMAIVGERFERNEYFVPEMLIAARAMQAGVNLLKPLLVQSGVEPIGKVAIGTVKGDLHDIGKNIVATMLRGVGFEIRDLGINVPAATFLNEARAYQPDVLALSALLTTTMPAMATITQKIKAEHANVSVIIGGAPVTQDFADEIGAHGYAEDAPGAVELLRRLVA